MQIVIILPLIMYVLLSYLSPNQSLIFNFTSSTHSDQRNLATPSFLLSRRFLGVVQQTKRLEEAAFLCARLKHYLFLAKISHLLRSETCSALGIPRARASLLQMRAARP